MCVSSCLVSSLFRILPHFLRLFSLLGCYYILHTITHTHTITLTQTFLGGVSSLHPLIAIFFLLFCSFFCCCATTSVLHLYTHFPCLSILFLSNMLLADTLFSSLSPIIFAVTAAALFRCVSISVSSLCHADNYFALTLNLSNRALIAQKHSLLLSLPRWCVKVIYCVHCVQTHTYG